MTEETLLVSGGTLVSPEGTRRADVFIRAGLIEEVFERESQVAADRILDAHGCYVAPGLVDPHCHFNTFSHHADDLQTLSTAALFGGVTTIIPFLIPGGGKGQPESLVEILDHFIARGRHESLVDFGFHMALWPRWSALEEIRACVDRGCTSFKMFMALPSLGRMVPDDLMVAFMEVIRDTGSLAMTHSENGLVTEYLEQRMRKERRTAPSDLGLSRPPELEEEATYRASCLAQVAGAPLYVVHVTCQGAAEAIGHARRRRWKVAGETCPQYLTLDEHAMETWGPLAKVAPPLRPSPHADVLWDALDKGVLSTVGSDHSAHPMARKERGREDVYDDVPFGAATIETMLRVLFSEGVLKNRLSLERLVAVTSVNPARIFGLYPRKGSIQRGSDGDFVILDPKATHTVSASNHHDRSGYSLFQGWELSGSIRAVIASGRLAVLEGEASDLAQRGDYLPRSQSSIPEGLL
jgi:dihydropyrimidinase